MSQHWKDLIEIPHAVQASDFVLKLSEGVSRAERTVETYVVTDSVQRAFGQALGLIRAALESGSSSATYLHGSFGSGKSHFMAVLDLLLDPQTSHLVRQLDGLARPIVKHEEWLGQKSLMMVPYHFLGASSMEERILGGYVDHVREHHPDAPLPAVYVSDRLIENAHDLRAKMGDETFFTELGGGVSPQEEVSGWGNLGWDAASYEAAAAIDDPTHEERQRLVSDLIANLLPSMTDYAAASDRGGGYVGLDEGLKIISDHAAGLGHDGLVLFLDELILWLSRRASDAEFIQREGQKLAKLVEAQHGDRAIPIISFVARQRSLSDFVGDAYTGQEKASFDFSLQWLSGRFNEIKLEQKDLHPIIHERLLRPKDARARELITQSFEQLQSRLQRRHRDIIRTRDSDEERFAQIYPFNPALVDALVALSTFLQRKRTALRLLLSLLVEQRETLRLGHIVPVGDLWDVVIAGDAPFNEVLQRNYQSARALWDQKLRPLLHEEHGLDPREAGDEADPRKLQAWDNDARLLKTLLIAALVPNVPALKDMTVSRLTALNISAVASLLPNMEETTVTHKLRSWAAQVGELRISEEHDDPRVSVQLSALDVDALLDRVLAEDNPGNRRRKIRQLLFEWMDLPTREGSHARLKIDWRGARRELHVLYRNVREMSHRELSGEGRGWTILLDYPFDQDDHNPIEDRITLEGYLRERPEGADTLAWLPWFLTSRGQRQLGRLVKVEYVLDRFDSFATEYPAESRPMLRQQLENLRNALRTELRSALEIAYGLRPGDSRLVDSSHELDGHLHSLRPDHDPRMPGGVDFATALRKIAQGALATRYPDAYDLPHERLTRGQARKILDVIEHTLHTPDQRYLVEDRKTRTLMRHYAAPVELGQMGEDHFVTEDHWRDRIERALAGHSGPLRVGDLREVLEPEDAQRGTPRLIEDLIICTYAMREQMALVQLDTEQDFDPGGLEDSYELRRRELPDPDAWTRALELGAEVFGITQEFPLLTPASLERFTDLLDDQIGRKRQLAHDLPGQLRAVGALLDLDAQTLDASARMTGARRLRDLLEALTGDPTDRITALVEHARDDLARAQITSQYRHLREHADLLGDDFIRQTLDRVGDLGGALPAEGQPLLEEARELLQVAQHVRDLARLRELSRRLFELITSAAPKKDAPKMESQTKPNTDSPPVTVHSAAEFEEQLRRIRDHLSAGHAVRIEFLEDA